MDQIAEKYQNLQEREAYLIETEQKVVQKRKESVEIQKHVDFSQKSVAYNTNLIKGEILTINIKYKYTCFNTFKQTRLKC